jgi:hypothetical protein
MAEAKTSYTRRLSDKIVVALKQAVAENKRDVAEHLMRALEADLSSMDERTAFQRQDTSYVEEAYALHKELDRKD